MLIRHGLLVALVGVMAVPACSHGTVGLKTPSGRTSRLSLPQQSDWRVGPITDAESYNDALELYRAGVSTVHNDRVRTQLITYAGSKIGPELAAGAGQNGFDRFVEMIDVLRNADPTGKGNVAATFFPSSRVFPAAVRSILVKAARQVLATFQPRGDLEKVFVARGILEYLGDHPAKQRRRIRALINWMDRARRAGGQVSVARVLGRVIEWIPTPFMVELDAWNVGRSVGAVLAAASVAHAGAGSRTVLGDGVAFALARPYLLAGNWAKAKAALAGLPPHRGRDPLLASLIDHAMAKGAVPADFVTLSDYYREEAPTVAEVVCRTAAGRFPRSAQPWFCLAKLALRRGQPLRALVDCERAVRRRPSWRRAWDQLAGLYMDRIRVLIERQDMKGVHRTVRLALDVESKARKRWPGHPLSVGMSTVYYAAGTAQTAAGDMMGALGSFAAALRYRNFVQARMEIGNIFFWKEKYKKAIDAYKAAILAAPKGGEGVYWLGKAAVNLARSLKRLGRVDQARQVLIRAGGNLLRLTTLVRNRDVRASLLVTEAFIVDALGRRKQAIRLLKVAVDQARKVGPIYSEALTFAVTRGLTELTLDIYNRAMAKKSVSEYHKAYATFWLLELGKRCGIEPIRLDAAMTLLRKLKGHKWYHRLAAWFRGEMTTKALSRFADAPGKKVEFLFYQSMRALDAGHIEQAKTLWREIKKTGMYVYFEYRMADWYLRHGPSCGGTAGK
ncbi:MAG: tetratricopeptide repeat protein [Deltaproteobacteria bacterium]|nr:tetratricopeptide repeat protein [Deltaproteobacteria bacterium]